MKLFTLFIVAVLVLAGCGDKIAGTPTPEPVKLDCDLIFPGPGAA